MKTKKTLLDTFKPELNLINFFWCFLVFLPILLKETYFRKIIEWFPFDLFNPNALIILIIIFVLGTVIISNEQLQQILFKWIFPILIWLGCYFHDINNHNVYLIFLSLFYLIIILFNITKQIVKNCEVEYINQGLISDDPIESDEEKDSFNRRDYARSIVSEIRKTVNKRAFNIAVTGAWGSGKTSFLNLIKGEMDKEVDDDKIDKHEKVKFITVKYNPWDFKEDKIIGFDLLKTISHELANEKHLQEKFKGLMVSLQGMNQSPWYKIIPYFLSGFHKEKSINEYRQEIGKILEHDKKKLVIFLDDLDRLDGDEILEVFKTIRNSFDIANTFFILGFDIDYVADQIYDKVKGERALEYLGKIFQMRLSMPSNVDFDFIRLLEEKVGGRLDERLPKNFAEFFRNLNTRDIISIVNGIKIFDQSTNHDQDYNLDVKVLLQIISLKNPELYTFLSANYSEILNETVNRNIFNGNEKPYIYFPRDLENVKIADFDNDKKKLILYLIYLMTPFGSKELSKDIYDSYFKFRTPDHLISRTAFYVAISENNQNFIDKHIGTDKENDLILNLERSGKNFKKLDSDQIEFIVRNLIEYHAKLLNKDIKFSQLINTNLFEFPGHSLTHNTVISNLEIYSTKKFLNYIENFEKNLKFLLLAKFWYLDDKSLDILENNFQEYINETHLECGYIFHLLYSYIWPRAFDRMEKVEEINKFRNDILQKINKHLLNDPINTIKPFVFARSISNNGFSYNSVLGSVDLIKDQLDPDDIKQKELIRWLGSGMFNDEEGFSVYHSLDYNLVFGEEYDYSFIVYSTL